MTKKMQIYRCDVCGNVVEVLHTGQGTLVCCGQPMQLKEEKKQEEGNEKHLPVVTSTDEGVEIKVGEVEHPMEDQHYIEWVEVITKEGAHRGFLNPADEPKSQFNISKDDVVAVRCYCNVHGLWKNTQ